MLEARRASAKRRLRCSAGPPQRLHRGTLSEYAFLGVLMPEDAVRTRLKRGRRFGWLYEWMVTTGPNYLTCPSFCYGRYRRASRTAVE